MSPKRPPTAKATIMLRDDGSMLGGQRARRKSSMQSGAAMNGKGECKKDDLTGWP